MISSNQYGNRHVRHLRRAIAAEHMPPRSSLQDHAARRKYTLAIMSHRPSPACGAQVGDELLISLPPTTHITLYSAR